MNREAVLVLLFRLAQLFMSEIKTTYFSKWWQIVFLIFGE